MSIRIKTAIAAVLVLAGATATAQNPPADASVEALSGQADMVFQGTVTDITYATSVEGIPHTFVTYRVEEILKGSYAAPTLTLRFIGGVKIEGNVMRKLSVSHAPKFESGQQDLLMVKGNTQTQCPLVHCAEGRFRFQDGLVTSEEGAVIARGAQGHVLALPPAAEQAGAGDSGSGARLRAEVRSDATPFDRAGFIAHVRDVIGRQAIQGMAATNAVQSADPKQAFKGPEAAVAAPPRERRVPQLPQSSNPAPQSEHDRQEIEALIRNGGNPVLPEKDVESLQRLPARPPR